MAKLFLDGIFSNISDSPSSVRITMPNYNGRSDVPQINLVGLITSDITFSAQNSWGTIVNDLTNLQDLASLVGSDSMFSWISASTMCWKGTSPLSIGIEVYLINYKKDLMLEEQLKTLVKLASIAKDPNATFGKDFKAMVHGGYAPDIFKGNDSFFTIGKISKATELKSTVDVARIYGSDDITQNAQAALQLQFGHKSRIRNLLLSKISVTESNIEVADVNGNNRKPLYYKVSAQFTGVRPLLTVDVDDMFNF